MVDLLIKNGKVIDGSGASGELKDVILDKGRIVDIGEFKAVQAARVVDAKGLVVCPGFIDMHSHEDATNLIAPEAEGFVAQGITTAVTGNCGISFAPMSETIKEQAFSLIGEAARLLPDSAWDSFGSYLDYLMKQGTSVNVFPLVGQGSVRAAVMGQTAARPSEEQMQQMQELVTQCMEEGAAGISTGLIYPPGSYAFTDELVEVTRPVGKKGGFYFSHVRGEGDTLLEAIQEEITIGRKTGAAIQHSHYKAMWSGNWDKALTGLQMIDKAQSEGIDMSPDMYPYAAGSTRLTAILPEWAQEGGLKDILARMPDPATRKKMTESMKSGGVFHMEDWSKVMIPNSANPAHIGRNIGEMAAEAGKTPFDWIFDAVLETKGNITMIIFAMSEDNVKMEMQHPTMMFGTDGWAFPFEGPLAVGAPHPRSYGTFPRVLGKYVREEKVLSLEEAIWKMCGFPAQKLRLKERGLIKKGYKADIVLFNPETVIDRADFLNPFQRPLGIEMVLVNGQVVIDHGAHTGARPGVVTSRE
jgi:N-acyl-D-amino-acid deacylase